MQNNICSIPPRLPVMGCIKIGEKGVEKTSSSGNKFRQPVKLNHFLITTTDRDDNGQGNLIHDEALMRKFAPNGEPLKEIPVRLIYNDLDANFRSQFVQYSGKTRTCYGDGVEAKKLKSNIVDGKIVPSWEDVPCSCGKEAFGYSGSDKCKMNGVLVCIIDGADSFGGVWKFSTTGFNSTIGIQSSLQLLFSLTSGNISNIPLKLVLSPKTVQTPNGSQSTIYMVSLLAKGDMVQLLENAKQVAQMRLQYAKEFQTIERQAALMLDGPLLEDAEIIEFYPDTQEGVAPSEKPPKETMSDRIAALARVEPSMAVEDKPDATTTTVGRWNNDDEVGITGNVMITHTNGQITLCEVVDIFPDGYQVILANGDFALILNTDVLKIERQ